MVSSLRVGGMEQFVVRLAGAQKRRRRAGGGPPEHDPSLVALHDGPLRAAADAAGLPVALPGGATAARRVLRAAAHFARLRPDVIHAHNPTSLHYAALGKLVSGARVVVTCHGQGLGGAARTPGAREWRLADAVVAVSRATARQMAEDAPAAADRLCVIYNGMEPGDASAEEEEGASNQRARARARLGLPGQGLVAIIVARVDGRKGHDTLLRALARLAADGDVPPATLLVVGDGEERPRVEALAESLGLSRLPRAICVRFLGFRADVPDLLAASDLFVLPSLSEGLPLSVLEAMARRLPVVATDVGGIPELVTDGAHGLLVPPGDAPALAAALRRLARDPALRDALGAAGYERVRREFSFEEMARRYDDLYRRCRRAARGAPRAGNAPPGRAT